MDHRPYVRSFRSMICKKERKFIPYVETPTPGVDDRIFDSSEKYTILPEPSIKKNKIVKTEHSVSVPMSQYQTWRRGLYGDDDANSILEMDFENPKRKDQYVLTDPTPGPRKLIYRMRKDTPLEQYTPSDFAATIYPIFRKLKDLKNYELPIRGKYMQTKEAQDGYNLAMDSLDKNGKFDLTKPSGAFAHTLGISPNILTEKFVPRRVDDIFNITPENVQRAQNTFGKFNRNDLTSARELLIRSMYAFNKLPPFVQANLANSGQAHVQNTFFNPKNQHFNGKIYFEAPERTYISSTGPTGMIGPHEEHHRELKDTGDGFDSKNPQSPIHQISNTYNNAMQQIDTKLFDSDPQTALQVLNRKWDQRDGRSQPYYESTDIAPFFDIATMIRTNSNLDSNGDYNGGEIFPNAHWMSGHGTDYYTGGGDYWGTKPHWMIIKELNSVIPQLLESDRGSELLKNELRPLYLAYLENQKMIHDNAPKNKIYQQKLKGRLF